jgi:hypothetical protein
LIDFQSSKNIKCSEPKETAFNFFHFDPLKCKTGTKPETTESHSTETNSSDNPKLDTKQPKNITEKSSLSIGTMNTSNIKYIYFSLIHSIVFSLKINWNYYKID